MNAQSQHKDNKKGQDSVLPVTPTGPMDMFSNDSNLDEPQDTEFKEKL